MDAALRSTESIPGIRLLRTATGLRFAHSRSADIVSVTEDLKFEQRGQLSNTGGSMTNPYLSFTMSATHAAPTAQVALKTFVNPTQAKLMHSNYYDTSPIYKQPTEVDQAIPAIPGTQQETSSYQGQADLPSFLTAYETISQTGSVIATLFMLWLVIKATTQLIATIKS